MRVPLVALITLTASITGCNRLQMIMPITQTREISSYAPKPLLDATSAQRFFDEQKSDATSDEPQQHPLVWSTPAGWGENPPSQMRLIDLRFGDQQEGECYLSAMPGAAGGLLPNINRWRGQMGLPAITDADLEKLPKKKLMGADCYYVELDGEFKGMGDAASAKKDYRLLGIIQSAPELTIFVKMTGPKALVLAQQANFDAFVSSVQFRKKQNIPSH